MNSHPLDMLGGEFFGRSEDLCGDNRSEGRVKSLVRGPPDKPTAVAYEDSAMPTTGTVPVPTKKKIRPSSASANLQSHPCYTTGLYDGNRPATAATAPSSGPGSGSLPLQQQRPKTQAGGPRFWGRREKETEAQENRRTTRRLTIGPTDGIGTTDDFIRHGPASASINQLLKGKVCLLV